MYAFMGPWLLVSRGEAMALIVLTMLMVLLLSRGFVTQARRFVRWSTVLQCVADKHVLIHKYIGGMLVLCAALHIVGHFLGSIPAIIGETDHSKINAAFTYGTQIRFNFNSWQGALQSWPAVTGVILVLILIAFWSLSNERVRRYSFEMFHYPHLMLIILWCVFLIAHGWKQWLGVGAPLASFSVAPAVLYYFIERILHIRKGSDPSIRIHNAIVKKNNVLLEIDTGSSGFAFNQGMYCMLKVPEISDFQWHPFTIASGGGKSKFQVLFAVVGDWTTKLKERISDAQAAKRDYPVICVRGGYGAPAQGMKNQEHIIMVGGGVGATPFLSFLSNICNTVEEGGFDPFEGVKSATFFWLSREPDDFLWVNEYSSIIKASPKLKDRVQIKLCMTKSLETNNQEANAAEVALFWLGLEVALNKFGSEELAHELGVPTQFGRPDWPKEFTKHVTELRESGKVKGPGVLSVAVFVCGKQVLVDSLGEACTAMTDERTKFRLYAEEF
jgi:predicted ferric reductase